MTISAPWSSPGRAGASVPGSIFHLAPKRLTQPSTIRRLARPKRDPAPVLALSEPYSRVASLRLLRDNGAAVGVGATMLLPFDFRLASSTARISFVFTRRGLVLEAGSAWFLPKLVGIPTALRWCIGGNMIDAQEALDRGLVGEVLEPEALLPRALELAQELTRDSAQDAVALTRRMIWHYAGQLDPFELLDLDERLSIELGASPDLFEGMAAFEERRTPAFPGRVSRDMPGNLPWSPR